VKFFGVNLDREKKTLASQKVMANFPKVWLVELFYGADIIHHRVFFFNVKQIFLKKIFVS
jgi:hypothetical protein